MLFALRNVEVTHGTRTALSIEHLDIETGSITAVMGPNGAGKTTLLKVLAGLLEPARGTITYRGELHTPDRAPSLRRKVCLVHQSPFLFNTTVLENVAFGLRARGISRVEIPERVRQALRVVGCADLDTRRARELSGGEVKRVAIARALVLDPEVLLLDEPLANVDQVTAKALEDVFRATEQRGHTLIFSTHDPRLAHRIARQVVVLREGHISPSAYENLFAGHRTVQAESTWFDTGKVRIAVPPGLPSAGHVSIGPDEILLSRHRLQSSARNVFQGRVIRIEERGEGVLDVTVEAGELFTVRITQQSYQELELAVGSSVYLTFKSTAVKPL